MTLKEMQQSIGSEAKQPEPSKVMKRTSLKDLQQKVGILFRDENNAVRKRESLEEIQRQVSRGYISDPEDIRMILRRTLWRPMNHIAAFLKDSMGAHFKTVQDECTDISVSLEDITLLDTWVLTDWSTMHIEEYTFTKKIMSELLDLSRKDIWFACLLNISINSLRNFPDFSISYQRRRNLSREISSCYINVFGKDIGDSITIGGTLSRLKDKLNTAWWVTTDINEYKKEILICGRLIWLITHLICVGCVNNIEARVSENDYPFRHLRDVLKYSNEYSAESREIHDTGTY